MTCLTHCSQRQPSWILLDYLVGIFGFPGCAEMSGLMGKKNISELDTPAAEEAATAHAPTPPPTIEEVQEAIVSTKTLLDDQQIQE